MNIKINMSDLGHGANRIGVLHGYNNIKLKNKELANKINYVPYTLQEENFKETNKKFYNTIYQACLNLYQEHLKAYQNNEFPILLGGDHSLSLASVKATLQHYQEDIGLIWIDAHTDINTFDVSNTGHIHGMPVAGLLGINDDKYNNLGNELRIKPENIIYFATRDIDYHEQVLVDKYNILNLTDMKIKATSLNERITEAINYLKDKVSKIHISLDLDSMNPEDIKGVSTPVAHGLNIDEPLKIIKAFNKEFDLVALDIVEYNPLEDIDENTLNYLDNLIKEIEIL
ncbi:MAG: arginase family protein [Bacilli bacterium]|jgi:arginase|nr:arginase family protein [Bacilli bacterium]